MLKKILLTTLVLCSFSATADGLMRPSNTSEYVTEGRFVKTPMTNPADFVITDTKTGCQYLLSYGSGVAQTPLGCFEEYKKK